MVVALQPHPWVCPRCEHPGRRHVERNMCIDCYRAVKATQQRARRLDPEKRARDWDARRRCYRKHKAKEIAYQKRYLVEHREHVRAVQRARYHADNARRRAMARDLYARKLWGLSWANLRHVRASWANDRPYERTVFAGLNRKGDPMYTTITVSLHSEFGTLRAYAAWVRADIAREAYEDGEDYMHGTIMDARVGAE